MSADSGQRDVIAERPQPCVKCGGAAHLVLKDGRRLCARCYRDERTTPAPPAG